ncbi:MAG: response regulator [Chlamydiota bacterium]
MAENNNSMKNLLVSDLQKLSAMIEDMEGASDLESLAKEAKALEGAAQLVGVSEVERLAAALKTYFRTHHGQPLGASELSKELYQQLLPLMKSLADNLIDNYQSWYEDHQQQWSSLITDIEKAAAFKATPDKDFFAPQERDAKDDKTLLAAFRNDSRQQLQQITTSLLALEEDLNSKKEIASIMRCAHSIKGAANIVHLKPIVKVAHALEDCFSGAYEDKHRFSSAAIDVIFEAVDLLSEWVDMAPEQLGEQRKEEEGIINDLRNLPEDYHDMPSPKKPAGDVEIKEVSGFHLEDGDLRVAVETINSIMEVAGEIKIEHNTLQELTYFLRELKSIQMDLARLINRTREKVYQQDISSDIERFIIEMMGKVGDSWETIANNIAVWDAFQWRFYNLTESLYRHALAARMRPFSDGIKGFPRLVRDLSKSLGKQVKLNIVGENTLVDRDILAKLEAPLNHLLRNAVDHGIELPQERIAADKPTQGQVCIEASHQAGMLTIKVADDGRGLDLEEIRSKIIEKKLVTPEAAHNLRDFELIDFLFLYGFSTAEKVSEISGRGVGMDIVYNMVQEVGGIIRATAEPGKGLTCHLQLPLTRSVIKALLVEIAGEPYAFPLTRIEKACQIPVKELHKRNERYYATIADKEVPLFEGSVILGLPSSQEPAEIFSVVTVSDGVHQYGLIVDKFIEEYEFVLQELDRRLGKVPNISASTITRDGRPVLVVDVAEILEATAHKIGRATRPAHPSSGKAAEPTILVVEDSPVIAAEEREILENDGYKVCVLKDGEAAWKALQDYNYNLLVTDIDMPKMNGIDLIKKVRSDQLMRTLKILVVSSKDTPEDIKVGKDAGADIYLTKAAVGEGSFLEGVKKLIEEVSSDG